MGRDRVVGMIILACSLVGILTYGLLLYAYPIIVLQLSIFAVATGVLLIVAWIGWTMVSASSPPTTRQPVASSSPAPRQEQSGNQAAGTSVTE